MAELATVVYVDGKAYGPGKVSARIAKKITNKKAFVQEGDEAPAAPPAPPSPYDDLSDEEVADAYSTNVGGEATEREAQVAELQALESDES